MCACVLCTYICSLCILIVYRLLHSSWTGSTACTQNYALCMFLVLFIHVIRGDIFDVIAVIIGCCYINHETHRVLSKTKKKKNIHMHANERASENRMEMKRKRKNDRKKSPKRNTNDDERREPIPTPRTIAVLTHHAMSCKQTISFTLCFLNFWIFIETTWKQVSFYITILILYTRTEHRVRF